MPWQSAPSLLIIIGAFNVAAGAMWSIQRIAYGKVRPCKLSCRYLTSTPLANPLVVLANRWIAALTFPPPSSLACLPRNVLSFALGKDREILRDQWKYGLETRDLRIEEYRRALAKQGK